MLNTSTLLATIIDEMGCACEDCRGYAWDKVNELQKDTGCPACKAEGCNCYVTELPIVTNP
jgi:hypothetical protein